VVARGPRSAITGREQVQQKSLLNHLVGKREHRRGHLKAERLRGFEVDDQLELGRLQNRQIGRSGAFEDSTGVNGDLAKLLGVIRRIADEPPIIDEFALKIHGRNSMLRREPHNPALQIIECWVIYDRKSTGTAADEACKCCVNGLSITGV